MPHSPTGSMQVERPFLDGWWIARAATLGGVRLPFEALPGLAMLLFDRTLYLGSDVGTLDIDCGSTPAALDILVVRGPNRWRFIPGIFQQRGNVLQLCLDLSGAARPPAFAAPFGSRLLLVTYVRAPIKDDAPGPRLASSTCTCARHSLVAAPGPRTGDITLS